MVGRVTNMKNLALPKIEALWIGFLGAVTAILIFSIVPSPAAEGRNNQLSFKL